VEGSRAENRDAVADVNEGGREKVALSWKVTSSVWGVLFLFCCIEIVLLLFFIFSVCDDDSACQ
jgi:hypothetical protein